MPPSSGVGPSTTSRWYPVAAIIAALSVQRCSGGRNAARPVASASSCTRARSREFAATPPPSTRLAAPTASAPSASFSSSWSTTASWNDAATSDVLHHRRLEPRERRRELARHRTRERDGAGIAVTREPVDHGAARVAEAEEPGDLVEGLPRGVVDGLPEDAVLARGVDRHHHRVPARHEQHRHRPREVGLLEPARVEVALEMVHADVRHAAHERERLRRAHAHEQRAGQARAVARGDGVDRLELDPGLAQGVGHHRHDEIDVRAARDFGHDPAVLRVQVDLARHHRRPDHSNVLDHRRGRLVARRLDSQDQNHEPIQRFGGS